MMRLARSVPRHAAPVALLLCLGVASCERKGIEEQQVPKGVEHVPAPADGAPIAGHQHAESENAAAAQPGATQGMPAAGQPSPGEEAIPGSVPQRWRHVAEPRPMRLATFQIPDESGPVELAITRFPGRVGGELANLNRWRGQMGLPAATEAEVEGMIERFEAPGFDGYTARIAGADMHMLAAGVYEAAHDRTWFVRVTASPDVADRLAPEVFGYARSIAGLGPEGP